MFFKVAIIRKREREREQLRKAQHCLDYWINQERDNKLESCFTEKIIIMSLMTKR